MNGRARMKMHMHMHMVLLRNVHKSKLLRGNVNVHHVHTQVKSLPMIISSHQSTIHPIIHVNVNRDSTSASTRSAGMNTRSSMNADSNSNINIRSFHIDPQQMSRQPHANSGTGIPSAYKVYRDRDSRYQPHQHGQHQNNNQNGHRENDNHYNNRDATNNNNNSNMSNSGNSNRDRGRERDRNGNNSYSGSGSGNDKNANGYKRTNNSYASTREKIRPTSRGQRPTNRRMEHRQGTGSASNLTSSSSSSSSSFVRQLEMENGRQSRGSNRESISSRPRSRSPSSSSSSSSPSNKYNDKYKGVGASGVTKKIERLQILQDEVRDLMQDYEKQLQLSHNKPQSQPQSQSQSQPLQDLHLHLDPTTLAENLVLTEELYRKTCIKLRQLVAGWSWVKPFPRYYAEQWAKNQHLDDKNPLPLVSATDYLNILENMRMRRYDLIQHCVQHGNVMDGSGDGTGTGTEGGHRQEDVQGQDQPRGFLQWVTDTFTNAVSSDSNRQSAGTDSSNGHGKIRENENCHVDSHGDSSAESTSAEKKTVMDLTAHISQDCTANVRLYDAVLNNCIQWRHIPVHVQVQESSDNDKHKPKPQMESLLSSMRYYAKRGNPNVQPDVKIYHKMMEFYKDSEKISEVKKSVTLLKDMMVMDIGKDDTDAKELGQNASGSNGSDANTSCQPTIETYTLAVSGFHGIGSTVDVKVEALEAADEVLRLMEKEYSYPVVGVDSNPGNRSETTANERKCKFETNDELVKLGVCDPYRAMLQNLIAVGPKVLPDYQQRVDDLMERMMGRNAYEHLLEDNDSVIDTSKMDHLILHDLIHIFTITNEKSQIAKARIILKKMEATRDSTFDSTLMWPDNFPVSNSYKSIIIGILHSTIDSDEGKSANGVASIDDALYATELLDTILRDKPSSRNSYSCYRCIRLWGATNSKEAGKMGEEIIGRLEISQVINGDESSMSDVVMRSKQSSLENWSSSAAAGEPGAARSAANLLDRMKERLDNEINSTDERSKREKGFFYIAVIRACAETVLDEDKENALEIAFDTYNTMVEESLTLTPYVFVQLMKCCQLVAPSSHDQALKLSKEVFQAACSNGLVNRHVLFLLKQVNYHLFESYKKKPEHSTHVKKMMPLEE